ncbi:MAG: class I adenylate-forming enzyme family protein [Halorientalis sp.]
MPELRTQTVTEAFAAVAEDHAGPAVRFEGEERSFADLAKAGDVVADALADLGHEKGDPGAIWLPNRPEWFEAYLGFAGVGAPVVTVNTRYRTHELEYMLEDSGTTTLVLQGSLLTRDFLAMLRDVCPAVDDVDPGDLGDATDLALERVVVLDPDGETDVPRAAYTYDDLLERGRAADDPADDVDVAPEDPATVFYTSGTTSQPKGVVHDHVSTVTHPFVMADWQEVTPADEALAVIPVCGVAGFDFSWAALFAGATLVLQETFDPADAARAIEEQELTYIAAVGEMYEAMLDTDHDMTALERGTAWLVDQDDLDAIEDQCEFPVDQPYGLSEGHSHMCLSPPDAPRAERHRAGGHPIHEDIEIQIRDPETAEVLEPNTPGELYLRGYVRMREYLNKPEKTAEEIDEDGWLATGDMGEIDEQGRLEYHSRIEDMLRLRGFRVTPQEVESAVEDHAAVEQAQVVGVPRGDGEEVAVAFVILAEGASVTEEELASFMNEHVADYKVPSRFEFVDSYPTTESPNGVKIQRSKLVERADEMVETSR